MPAPVSTDLVWNAVGKHLFGVLAYVNPRNEARSAGVVYAVSDRKLYVTTGKSAWKAKHIPLNPDVSFTVTIPKRIPFLPFLKVPAAVITFQGSAELLGVDDVDESILARLFRGMEVTDEFRRDTAVIEITPSGDFVTYGVGIPLMKMRNPDEARGRAPVA